MTTENLKHAAEPYEYREVNFHGRHQMFPNTKTELLKDIKGKTAV